MDDKERISSISDLYSIFQENYELGRRIESANVKKKN